MIVKICDCNGQLFVELHIHRLTIEEASHLLTEANGSRADPECRRNAVGEQDRKENSE
jgi:hypothetical protein